MCGFLLGFEAGQIQERVWRAEDEGLDADEEGEECGLVCLPAFRGVARPGIE